MVSEGDAAPMFTGTYKGSEHETFDLDDDGQIAYDWVAHDPTNEPDYEELVAAAEDAA